MHQWFNLVCSCLVAVELRNLQGFPQFSYHWPVEPSSILKLSNSSSILFTISINVIQFVLIKNRIWTKKSESKISGWPHWFKVSISHFYVEVNEESSSRLDNGIAYYVLNHLEWVHTHIASCKKTAFLGPGSYMNELSACVLGSSVQLQRVGGGASMS